MKIQLGLGAIRSFKRLSYTPWHALAEFIDNSTQSYRDNKAVLDAAYRSEGSRLAVDINYQSTDGGRIHVRDNAMGMSEQELTRALIIGEPPPPPRWRSQYGFGLKTAASWFGNVWTVETKRLGSPIGFRVTVDVEQVAAGNPTVHVEQIRDRRPDEHFTVIEIRRLNRLLHAKTKTKIRDFLRSMYRKDLRDGTLQLTWMTEPLVWDEDLVFAENGELHHDFAFEIEGKPVTGWAGVLAKGSRAKAGFSMLHAGRVVKGWPDPWRPQEVYGQFQGSNNLVNQRVVGEINLDEFAVSHTKDDILWVDDEEQEVEIALREAIKDLIKAANDLRRPVGVSPTRSDLKEAALGLQRSLSSDDLRERWLRLDRPSEVELGSRAAGIVARASRRAPDFAASADGLSMRGYLGHELVEGDQYLVASNNAGQLAIVINMNHPFVAGMKADLLLRHLEHCAFEVLARWRLGREAGATSEEAVTYFKDELLRIASASRISAG